MEKTRILSKKDSVTYYDAQLFFETRNSVGKRKREQQRNSYFFPRQESEPIVNE